MDDLIYDPQNWYWIVGGDEAKVYSSARGDYVAADDGTYVAWRTSGGIPTRIPTAAELGAVLSQSSVRPTHADVLDGYLSEQSKRLTIQIVAKILLWLVNEVRQLKGQSSLNAAQFKVSIKERL